MWILLNKCAIKSMVQLLRRSMETFSIRDLCERTREPVREAEAGHLFVVANHGRPLFVAVPLDEHLLKGGVAVAPAIRLFGEKVASLGKVAKLARLSIEDFIARLGIVGIPAVDHPPEERDDEFGRFEADRPRSWPSPTPRRLCQEYPHTYGVAP
jgi:antitoxin (DNA-binding transcriptional repressor) of toxin-antitoxin stability system